MYKRTHSSGDLLVDVGIRVFAQLMVAFVMAVCGWLTWIATSRPVEPGEYALVSRIEDNGSKSTHSWSICQKGDENAYWICQEDTGRVQRYLGLVPEGLTLVSSYELYFWSLDVRETYLCEDASGSVFSCTIGEEPTRGNPVTLPACPMLVASFAYVSWSQEHVYHVCRFGHDYILVEVGSNSIKTLDVPDDTIITAATNNDADSFDPAFFGTTGGVQGWGEIRVTVQ